MKQYKIHSIAIAVITSVLIAACGNITVPEAQPEADLYTASQARMVSLPAELDVNLGSHNAGLFEIADGWSNGDMFNATWRASQVNFGGGRMRLTLDWDSHGSNPPYQSGEYRTHGFYHYGLYEVRMRAARGDGVVSSFFTYTGPSDDQPWDEIDIEFLGKNTTQMQTNYYTNGVGGKEVMIDLGFDAADSFNNYAFEWLPDRINWYVNGQLVHTENGSKGPIPSHESKIMVNLWPGIGVDEWLNPFNNSNLPITAEYEWIRYTPYTESPIAVPGGPHEPGNQQPFHGSPMTIPGRIQAQDFDTGGSGIAYSDTTTANQGGSYRTNESVDIQPASDSAGGNYNVGWIAEGEWLEYTVNVSQSGIYDLHFRVASAVNGGALRAYMNGTDISGQVHFNGTGGWQNWTSVTAHGISLDSGQQTLRIAMEASNFNLNFIDFELKSSASPPSQNSPAGGNMISNGTFSNGDNSWFLGTYEGGGANLNTNDAGLVNIWNGGSQIWSVQLIQEGLSLEPGASYLVSFDAAAASNRSIDVSVNQSVSPWGSFSGSTSFTLSPEWNHYSMEFTMTDPYEPNARLELNLGRNSSNVHFNNISIVRL